MKKYFLLFLVSALVSSLAVAQSGPNKLRIGNECELYPRLIDSIYSYDWNKSTNQWTPAIIRHYENSEDKYSRLIFLDGNTRKPIRKWDYYYDSSGNRDLEISSFWGNNMWIVNLKKESEFDANNKKLDELRNNFRDGVWSFNSYYYFEYSEGRVDKVHYQLKDINGMLQDQTVSEYYYENDKLSEVRIRNASDGSLMEVNRYFYDLENQPLKEFVILLPDPADPANKLTTFRRRLYYYDDYYLLREVLFEEMQGGQWEVFSKYVYYYKLDFAKKVSICHNGNSICVSVNALKAHLAHGDNLGQCANDVKNWNNKGESEAGIKTKLPFTIYPNPASDKFVVKFTGSESADARRVQLIDSHGKLVLSQNTKGENEITIYRGTFESGKYIIRLIGKETYIAKVIFE